MRLDYNEIYFGNCPDGTDVVSGFRFTNITTPPGAIIQQARIEFYVEGWDGRPSIAARFFGEKSLNSPTFSMTNRPENHALTDASMMWVVEEQWLNSEYKPGRFLFTELSYSCDKCYHFIRPRFLSRLGCREGLLSVGC